MSRSTFGKFATCSCGRKFDARHKAKHSTHLWPVTLCRKCGLAWSAEHRDGEDPAKIEAAFQRAKAHNRKHMHVTADDCWRGNALASVVGEDVPCEA